MPQYFKHNSARRDGNQKPASKGKQFLKSLQIMSVVSNASPRKTLVACIFFFGMVIGIEMGSHFKKDNRVNLLSMAFKNPKTEKVLGYSIPDLQDIWQSVSIQIESVAPSWSQSSPNSGGSLGAVVSEQKLGGDWDTELPQSASDIGIGTSKLLARSKYAVVRFVGENPAGAGFSGVEFEAKQKEALGKENDSVPVTNIAYNINAMMENYFEPLLKRITGGAEALAKVNIQAAYYAPEFIRNAQNDLKNSYDNAYVLDTQTMKFFPNSCFQNGQSLAANCPQFPFSAGHDPSIVAHELGHVIFNLLREQKSFEGLQWFALNEGYADYFASAFFNDPVVGKIWKAGANKNGSLRKLTDAPKISEFELEEDVHRIGQVWSGILWKLRQQTSEPQLFDKAVLESILYLGETEKTRLGDGVSALLKSLELNGLFNLKNSLLALSNAAELDVVPRDGLNYPGKKSKEIGLCGVVGKGKFVGFSQNFGFSFLLLLPVFSILFVRVGSKLFVVLCFLFFGSGCTLFKEKKGSNSKPDGAGFSYRCSKEILGKDILGESAEQTFVLNFTQLKQSKVVVSEEKNVSRILASNNDFLSDEAAVVLLVDKESNRIDQVRDLNGILLELDLRSNKVSIERAEQQRNIEVSKLIIQKTLQAEKTFQKLAAQSQAENSKSQNCQLANRVFSSEEGSYSLKNGSLKAQKGFDFSLPSIIELLPASFAAKNSESCVQVDTNEKVLNCKMLGVFE